MSQSSKSSIDNETMQTAVAVVAEVADKFSDNEPGDEATKVDPDSISEGDESKCLVKGSSDSNATEDGEEEEESANKDESETEVADKESTIEQEGPTSSRASKRFSPSDNESASKKKKMAIQNLEQMKNPFVGLTEGFSSLSKMVRLMVETLKEVQAKQMMKKAQEEKVKAEDVEEVEKPE